MSRYIIFKKDITEDQTHYICDNIVKSNQTYVKEQHTGRTANVVCLPNNKIFNC